MRILGVVALGAALAGWAASRHHLARWDCHRSPNGGFERHRSCWRGCRLRQHLRPAARDEAPNIARAGAVKSTGEADSLPIAVSRI